MIDPERQPLREITCGYTTAGTAWRWRDGWLPDSRIYLYPDVSVPNRDDQWRYEESLVVVDLISLLALPRVLLEWVRATRSKPERDWNVQQDFAPRWDLGVSQHPFLYGIVEKLCDSLVFDPAPPTMLVAAWIETHGGDLPTIGAMPPSSSV